MSDELIFGALGATVRKGSRVDYLRSLLEKEQVEVVDPTGEYAEMKDKFNTRGSLL